MGTSLEQRIYGDAVAIISQEGLVKYLSSNPFTSNTIKAEQHLASVASILYGVQNYDSPSQPCLEICEWKIELGLNSLLERRLLCILWVLIDIELLRCRATPKFVS
jgi:hypothetical protein